MVSIIGGVLLRRIVRVRNGGRFGGIFGSVLTFTGWALGQLPIVFMEILDEVVVPLHRVIGPGPFQAAGEGVATFAAAVAVLPAEALLLHSGPLRFGADTVIRGGAMRFAEGVSAGQ